MTQTLKHRRIPISKLIVSSSNPRFKPSNNQNHAIQVMISKERDHIKKLARDIVDHGLNPTKSLATYSQNGKYIVLEGNRRVVALKLLDDPGIADDDELQKFFIKLKKKIPNLPNVPCVVFKTQDDARHWVELEHTGPNQGAGIVPWDTIQKQRYRFQDTFLFVIFFIDF